jgi:hypothetical protein
LIDLSNQGLVLRVRKLGQFISEPWRVRENLNYLFVIETLEFIGLTFCFLDLFLLIFDDAGRFADLL